MNIYVMTVVTNKESDRINVETYLYRRADNAWENFLEHVMNHSNEDLDPDEGPDAYMDIIHPRKQAVQWAASQQEGPDRGIEWFEDVDGGWNLVTLEKVTVS